MKKIIFVIIFLLFTYSPSFAQTDNQLTNPSVTELTVTSFPIPTPEVVNYSTTIVSGTVTQINGQVITIDKGNGSTQTLNIPNKIKIIKYGNENSSISDIKVNDTLNVKEDSNQAIVSIEDTTKLSTSQFIWSILDLILVILFVAFISLFLIKKRSENNKN